jgi:hypothetical protein
MDRPNLSRRDFTKFAAAAFGGVVAGAMIGCGDGGAKPGTGGAKPAGGTAVAAGSGEMHACAGLNGCKGQGNDGKNACAGQGGCASKSMAHECKGHNACKNQGGCGEAMGANECKGHGGCAVPMKDKDAWQKARDKFEEKMKAAGKSFGSPPAKSEAAEKKDS